MIFQLRNGLRPLKELNLDLYKIFSNFITTPYFCGRFKSC